MCGICGKVSLNRDVDEALIRRMCSVLTHRRPDDEGAWVLDSAKHSLNNFESENLWLKIVDKVCIFGDNVNYELY